MNKILIVLATLATIFITNFYLEEKRQSKSLRTCIEQIKPNSDGLTIDIEDIMLCKNVYDHKTNYEIELIKAVKKKQFDGPIRLQ